MLVPSPHDEERERTGLLLSQKMIGAAAAAFGVAATAIFAVSPTLAQGGGPNDAAIAAQRRAEFEKQMGITAAQKAKIDAITKKYKPRIDTVQAKYRKKAEPLQKQMIALQQQMMALQQQFANEVKPTATQMDKEIRAVLTPAQQAKIKKLEEQQRQQMQQSAIPH